MRWPQRPIGTSSWHLTRRRLFCRSCSLLWAADGYSLRSEWRQGVDWIWTLSLAIVGFLAFVVGGFDKVTAVVGPFLILASCLSLLRQTGRLSLDVEIPILVILAGVLALIARLPAIPVPKWILRDPSSKQ